MNFYSHSGPAGTKEHPDSSDFEYARGALTDCKKQIVAANWKMNLTHKEVKPYLDSFLAEVGEVNKVQVVFIPSFTSISEFADALEESPSFQRVGGSRHALGKGRGLHGRDQRRNESIE